MNSSNQPGNTATPGAPVSSPACSRTSATPPEAPQLQHEHAGEDAGGAPSVEDLRALLAERLRQTAGQPTPDPLSFAQQRLWFLDQLQPNSPLYNIPSVVRLTGQLQLQALEESLDCILARHEILRTRFISLEGRPAQVIDPHSRLKLALEDLSGLPEPQRQLQTEQRIRQEATRPFDLAAGPLVRATLLRLAPQEHVLVLLMHHIVSDEWSFRVLYRELAALYSGFVQGQPARLPELPIQYGDYAQWQQDWLQGPVLEEQLGFWKNQLSGNPPGTELAADHPRRATQGVLGAARWRTLDKNLSGNIGQLAVRERATLFMVLLAAFKALLFRYTQQEDILVGSPVAGRNRLETEGLIGFFVNTLPLRTRVTGDLTFRQLLERVRETALSAYSHQDLPFEKLVEALHPERSLNHTPFVKLMFLFQRDDSEPIDLPALKIDFLDSGTDTAKFDVTFGVFDTDHGLRLRAEYNTELFDTETIDRLLLHYETLFQSIVTRPDQRIGELPMLTVAERRQLLVEWNDTRREYPRNLCVPEVFEQQAERSPRSVAAVFGSRRLTYGELNARANQLARFLKKAGVGPGTNVGVCAERSLEMLVGLLGILKAGAAYAPLDPALPKGRLAAMLEALQVSAFLVQRRFMHCLSDALARDCNAANRTPSGESRSSTPAPALICLDTYWQSIRKEDTANLCCQVDAEALAYISFTSGSTGQPKGICVPHRGIVRLVKNSGFVTFSPSEVLLQNAPVSFDASSFEIWGALLNGARLVLAPPELSSLSALGDLIARHGVTTAWFTTGLFNQLIEAIPKGLTNLRQVLTGGDALSPPHIRKALAILPGCRLFNGYGPTENSTFTTVYPIPPGFDGQRPVPIGKPIPNTQCYVLDKCLQPVPIGVPGELYAGGDGLAAGYLNRPELTAESFIPNPFQPGSLLYKTGDLVRYLPDGNLEFLGRIDLQVKIRGFRVELGEIESALLQHPAVRQCAVAAPAGPGGVRQLAAYVVRAPGSAVGSDELRHFLQKRLPEYMLPSFITFLDGLPLSPNGKVDRNALPPPEPARECVAGLTEPDDELERQLKEIWETVLETRPIGRHSKFFALGGHSLLAVRLVDRIEKKFGKQLRVAAVFEHPTIAQFAELLRDSQPRSTGSAIVEIQPHGSRPPLLLVHGAGGGMFWGYNNLARHLAPDQPVFAFKSRGLDGLDEFPTIETMAEAYLADLCAFQPRGPYYLGGYCFGGVVAYEMARRLRAQGDRVGLLVLINSSPPNSSYGRFRWTPASTVKFSKNLCLKSAYLLREYPELSCQFFLWKCRWLLRRSRRRLLGACPGPICGPVNEWIYFKECPQDQHRIWQTHLTALTAYQPKTYPGPLTLFRSSIHLLCCSFDHRYGWGEFALGGVDVKLVPGPHERIMVEPGLRALAAELQVSLAQAQDGR